MANSYFHDYTKDLKNANQRYGYSYTDFDKMLSYFNLSRLPDYDNAAEAYIGHIFMSRPSLYVGKSSSPWSSASTIATENLTAMKNHPMTAAFANDVYGEKMLYQLSDYNKSAWLPIFTTKAMSYAVTDFELKTVEKGNTFYGHVIKYGKHSEEHKVSNTMSIDIRNDRYLSVLKMIHLWMSYIYLVSKTDYITPAIVNQYNGVLDYGASLYYIVTRRDDKEIVFWDKKVGVFPIRDPLSIFTYQDLPFTEDRFTVDFSYGIGCDPCDPSILMDINVLSGDSFTTIESKTKNGYKDLEGSTRGTKYLANGRVPDYKESPFVRGDVYAQNPYISMKKVNGNLKYYLMWED